MAHDGVPLPHTRWLMAGRREGKHGLFRFLSSRDVHVVGAVVT